MLSTCTALLFLIGDLSNVLRVFCFMERNPNKRNDGSISFAGFRFIVRVDRSTMWVVHRQTLVWGSMANMYLGLVLFPSEGAASH